jgi:hypothetical protein
MGAPLVVGDGSRQVDDDAVVKGVRKAATWFFIGRLRAGR